MTVPEDEFRRLLHEAADAAPVDDAALQADLATALDRARRARTLRTVTASTVGVVLLGGVAWTAAAQPWNPPESTPSSTATVTPTATPTSTPSPTSEPTPTPAPTPEPTPEPPPAPEGSDIAYPVCGEVFALPERVPQLSLELEGGLTEWAPPPASGRTGTLTGDATLTNQGGDDVVGYPDLQVYLVVVDTEGRVVATEANPETPTAEYYSQLALSAGDTAAVAVGLGSACPGAGGDDARVLSAGDYQAYGLSNLYGDGQVVLQQAQGGPWPLTISTQAPAVRPDLPMEDRPLLAGAAFLGSECSVPFDPRPTTALSITAGDIRSPRTADDSIDELEITVTAGAPIDREVVFAAVLLTQDGLLVNHVPATDAVASLTMSTGTSLTLDTWSTLTDCEYQPLPAGAYEAHPVLVQGAAEGLVVVARAPSQEVVIE
ncbi:hypothetical protein [Serinibacter arcticus]|uniref:Uncharacterized protein n=1 Tax=Serinibacter arcticus TaxID=1655435 RepID=A0A4Z1E378_9MICO|nr:hypothetical protein [Serinibacter arcticus]TGO06555.1 hypothetical protein SERN_0747 [Serinibacter arcticus]